MNIPETLPLSAKAQRRLRIGLITTTVVMVLYTIVGFFILPLIIEHFMLQGLQDKTGHTASVNAIRVNPYTFEVTIEGFEMAEPKQPPYFTFHKLYLNIQPTSVFQSAYQVQTIALEQPKLHVLIDDQGVHLPQFQAEPAEKEAEDASPILLSIPKIILKQGLLTFSDLRKVQKVEKAIGLNLVQLTQFSTQPGASTTYLVQLTTEDQESLQLSGAFELFPFSSKGKFDIHQFQLAPYQPYLADFIQGELKQGAVSLSIPFQVALEPQISVNITKGEIRLENFLMHLLGHPVAQIQLTALQQVDFNLSDNQLTIGQAKLEQAQIRVDRSAENAINWASFVKPTKTPQQKPTKTDSDKIDVHLNELSIQQVNVEFNDAIPSTPTTTQLNLTDFSLSQFHLNQDTDFPFRLNLRLNEKGKLNLKGMANPEFNRVYASLSLTGFDLADFQPYIEPFLKAKLSSGIFEGAGHLAYTPNMPSPKPLWKGDLSIHQFDLQDASGTQSLTQWHALSLRKMLVPYALDHLRIDRIEIDQPFAHIVIDQDARLNLAEIVIQKDAQPDPKESEDTKPFAIHIGDISVQNGSMFFADNSLPLDFSTNIQELNGHVSELDSTSKTPSSILLKGTVDQYGSANISALTTLFQPTDNSEFNIRFKNLSLTNMTPYSAKFAGYRIDQGKLSLDLKYKILQHQLTATNHIALDQLTLGNTFDSPDAPSLPLKFAVALLKDSDGKIEIDLPVSGDLSNPEVSVARLIGKALVTVITNIVTSPFKFLGDLMGLDGEDLAKIEFDAGESALTPPTQEKLDKLSDALKKRPQIKLQASGCYQLSVDQPALLEKAYQQQIATILEQLKSEPVTPKNKQHLAMKRLYASQFSQEALGDLEITHTKIVKSQTHEDKAVEAKQAQAIFDEVAYYAAIKQQLIDAVVLEPNVVQQLGDARRNTITGYLIQTKTLPAAQIKGGEPEEGTAASDSVLCELTLVTD